MGTGGERLPSVAAPNSSCFLKLRREEHRRTKHDSSFSKWKILIGPTDWENHSLGKEGSERYRVHNLPASSSPGVYEIGVAVWVNGSGREVGKLDPARIVVAYLGQAECVRARLQSYGRGGAHLEKIEKQKKSNYIYDNVGYSCEPAVYGAESASRGLFAEIFARGYPIVYRWAPLNSKKDAERAESKLLAVFDYPWNKVGNGSRRPIDVLFKIDQISSKRITSTMSTLKIMKFLKTLTQKPAVGVGIKSMQKLPPASKLNRDEELDDGAYKKNRNLHGRVLKFGRSHPRIVSISSSSSTDDVNPNSSFCGVRLDDEGSICMNQPVKGRKRCLEHKGKKIYSGSFRAESVAARKGLVYIAEPREGCDGDLEGYSHDKKEKTCSSSKKGDSMSNDGCVVAYGEQIFSPICGVILYDGSACTLKPVTGRKRCEKHKGRRIQQRSTAPLSKTELG